MKGATMWGANVSDWGNTFCGWNGSMGHGPWFFGWLFPLLFWCLILFLAFSVLRRLFSRTPLANHQDSALNILRNRFAAGEINETEYHAQKAVLSKS